ncbi:hypothetical protein ACWKSP_15875 [Micromonosporaceae bacterium Da 78-11]
MWTCANCKDVNGDDEGSCAVCGGPRPPVGAVTDQHPEPTLPIAPDPIIASPIAADPAFVDPGFDDPGFDGAVFDGPDGFDPVEQPVGAAAWEQAEPGPVRRKRTGAVLLLAVLVAVLIAGAVGIPRLLRSSDDPTSTAEGTVPTTDLQPAPTDTDQSETDQSEPAPTDPVPSDLFNEGSTDEPAPPGSGLVQIDPGLTDDRATGIGLMLDTYFSGINAKDYAKVATVLDPAGSIDPGNADEMTDLARGTRSTRDSDISLNRLLDLGGDQVRAEVTFRSAQKAGDGPRGRTGETCTRWDIAYTLSIDPYRIVRSKASSQPC